MSSNQVLFAVQQDSPVRHAEDILLDAERTSRARLCALKRLRLWSHTLPRQMVNLAFYLHEHYGSEGDKIGDLLDVIVAGHSELQEALAVFGVSNAQLPLFEIEGSVDCDAVCIFTWVLAFIPATAEHKAALMEALHDPTRALAFTRSVELYFPVAQTKRLAAEVTPEEEHYAVAAATDAVQPSWTLLENFNAAKAIYGRDAQLRCAVEGKRINTQPPAAQSGAATAAPPVCAENEQHGNNV